MKLVKDLVRFTSFQGKKLLDNYDIQNSILKQLNYNKRDKSIAIPSVSFHDCQIVKKK